MRPPSGFISSLAAIAIMFLSLSAQAQVRKEYTLDKGWMFSKGDFPAAIQPEFNDAKWERVTVPHDWAIKGPFSAVNDAQKVKIEQNLEKEATTKSGRTGGLPFIGVGWYRLKIKVPEFGAGKTATLLFDGAMSHARVYVNGQEVGFWPYGYNSFQFDISKQLKDGQENTIAVRLENFTEQSRWYPGAGIYRNVHLFITNDAHIPLWGAYLTTPLAEKELATVNLKTNVVSKGSRDLKLVTEIKDEKGHLVGSNTAILPDATPSTFNQEFTVRNPALWSPETPVLYSATSKLYSGETLLDTTSTRFGIRSIAYNPEKGFALNGLVRKFKGVCNHHDLGPLGAAINTAALRRQLTILKDMGCDAVRTSHNMPAPELVDLCDEMGFMLMVESFDEWKTPKVKNGYNKFFEEWSEKDLVNMVHRDRNHPSVVMWSIGNEIPDQGMKGGQKLARKLQDIVHREDPTRPVTTGIDRFDAAINNMFAAALDIPGFNYKPSRYSEAYTKLPQGLVLGSETASTLSSRGIYKFPAEAVKDKQYDDNQTSSYDLEYCRWSTLPDDEFAKQDSLNYVIGEFVWTGFDYLGEPTPYDTKWPSHSSYFGIIDLAGLPKDRYYLYRSRWNTTAPTLHLLPHWTWPGREGQVTPVYCYTSYPSAELFVNGKSQGRRSKNDSSNLTRYRLMWNDVKYEPGVLKVVAYDSTGKVSGEETIKTAGKPHHLELTADRKKLDADGKDLSYVTVRIVDAEGNLCPWAQDEVKFSVSGAGKFKVVANGDATNLELFHVPSMHAFNGMLVATIQSKETPGNIQLKATAKGIKPAVIVVESK